MGNTDLGIERHPALSENNVQFGDCRYEWLLSLMGKSGKYLRPYSSTPIRSTSCVGDIVGLLVIVGDHVGCDDGGVDVLGDSDGFIDTDGRNDNVGLVEGTMDDDGDSEGIDDENSDGWMLG